MANLQPYSKISAREPNEEINPVLGAEGGIDDYLDSNPELESLEDDLQDAVPVAAPVNPVKNMVSQRVGLGANSQDIENDPLMQDYKKGENSVKDFLKAKLGADRISNFGQAAAQAARGAANPIENEALYNNIQHQNSELLKANSSEQERRQKVIEAIEGRKSREAIAQNAAEYKKAALGLSQRRLDDASKSKDDRLSSMNTGRANTLLNNPGINKEQTKLNAARSVQSLIDGIKSGEITDSKNIRNQLTNMIATIELGSPGGVSDRHEMGINTLYSKLKDAESMLSSSPTSTIPPEFLNQLQTEANALGDRAAKNYVAMKNSILSGADLSGGNPEVSPGQIHQLVKQRSSTFLSENGYDPETGERIRKSKGMSSPKKKPGDLIKYKGKMYRVGSDGNTLDEVM